uniref:Cytochrome b n=1 Tax=Histiostoma blomquisti TaxID=1902798 RepID=A0A342Y131_9ACAR|nr:cytochrome b [Histiostoma blomquisti]AOR08483.1 cytochrome b [Histiostoma blomquisti]
MKKTKMMTKDPLIMMLNKSLVNLPTPSSISYLWNMGFILGMTLTLQLITGVLLSMNYIPHTSMAFESIMHTMRDIDSGWMMRYLHMNGASLFFMSMYFHLFRGIYFNSPKKLPMVWISGVMILLCSMMAAFLGYVLPWGQMSFWGATVITNMLTAVPYIGSKVTLWLWGNFSVSQPTLNRFFSLHFLMPLLLTMLVLLHLMLLHKSGSSNPMGLEPNLDKMKFFPLFLIKDSTPLLFIIMVMMALVSTNPNMLGDVENFSMAAMDVTPTHIQPEWYFLFAYAILRSIPSKLGGVVAMAMSIMMLTTLTLKSTTLNKKFNPVANKMFWMFVSTAAMLTWIGANPVETPFILVGQLAAALYFTLMIYL